MLTRRPLLARLATTDPACRVLIWGVMAWPLNRLRSLIVAIVIVAIVLCCMGTGPSAAQSASTDREAPTGAVGQWSGLWAVASTGARTTGLQLGSSHAALMVLPARVSGRAIVRESHVLAPPGFRRLLPLRI